MEKQTVTGWLDNMGGILEELSCQYSKRLWDQYTTGKSSPCPELDEKWRQFFGDETVLPKIDDLMAQFGDNYLKRELFAWKNEFLEQKINSLPRVKELQYRLRQKIHSASFLINGAKIPLQKYWKLITQEDEPLLRKSLWLERARFNLNIEDDLKELIFQLNQAAQNYGYHNYYDFILSKSELDMDYLVQSINYFEEVSRPLAETVILNTYPALGIQPVEPWDVEYGRYKSVKDYEKYFQADRAVAALLSFCQNLGFDNYHNQITIDCEERESKVPGCYFFACHIPDDLRLTINPMCGDRFYENLFHEYGHALHARFRTIKQPIFKVEPACFSEGMATLFSYFLADPKWLKEYTLMTDDEINRYLQTRNLWFYSFRTAVSWILFETEIYRNPHCDFNQVYWDIYERFFLLPGKRQVHFWASSPLLSTHPVYLFNYFMAELIAAQVGNYIQTHFSGYLKNKDISLWLIKHFFSSGNSMNWQQRIREATGEGPDIKYLIANVTKLI